MRVLGQIVHAFVAHDSTNLIENLSYILRPALYLAKQLAKQLILTEPAVCLYKSDMPSCNTGSHASVCREYVCSFNDIELRLWS